MSFSKPCVPLVEQGSTSHFLNPIMDGHLMYVKGMGRGKITPQSKIFKNDPKKLKLTPKLEHIKIFPKHKEKICSDPYF